LLKEFNVYEGGLLTSIFWCEGFVGTAVPPVRVCGNCSATS